MEDLGSRSFIIMNGVIGISNLILKQKANVIISTGGWSVGICQVRQRRRTTTTN